jgi:hypothetical protein
LMIVVPPVFVRAADEKPLTQEQLIEMSAGPLKSYPDEVVKYVNNRGVTFFPTNTNLRWLEKAGVHQSVVATVRNKVASQMRIKVCRFECDDQALAKKFEEAMIRRLVNTKQGEIAPFGYVPLDRNPGPPKGFDDNVKPEPNVFYILLQGWIRKTPTGFALDPQVIYQDPSGKQYPLPDAGNPPKTLTMQTIESAAGELIDWGINTVRMYGQT